MLFLAEAAHEHGEGVWERYIDLVTDPAHIMLEATIIIIIDVLIGLLLWPLIKRWVAEHDRKKHAHQHCEDAHPKPEYKQGDIL